MKDRNCLLTMDTINKKVISVVFLYLEITVNKYKLKVFLKLWLFKIKINLIFLKV